MASMATIGTMATLASAGISAMGTLAAGRAQQDALNYEAQQIDVKANEERAAAQQESQQLRRRKDLMLSALQARAAASGFSASDESTLDLAGDIETYGTLQEQMAAYGGASRQSALRRTAEGRRMSGRAARRGAGYSAAGTILGGISSMARYGSFGGSSYQGRYG